MTVKDWFRDKNVKPYSQMTVKEYRIFLYKILAENCKLRADIQFLQKQNEILKNLFIGGINETI